MVLDIASVTPSIEGTADAFQGSPYAPEAAEATKGTAALLPGTTCASLSDKTAEGTATTFS